MKTKKIIIIFLLTAPIVQSTPLDTLKNVKKNLEDAKKQVASSVEKLKEGYTKTNNDVVKKLETTANDLSPQVALIKKALDLSQSVRVIMLALTGTVILAPIMGSALIIFGDAPEILNDLYGTLVGVKNTLNNVKNNIQPTNELLNPQTDTRGVYKAFANTQAKFDESIKIIDEIVAGFEMALAEI